MTPRPSLLVILAAACVAGNGFGADPDPGDVDTIFAEYDGTRSPGCSMAVYRNGEIAYARGYGMANLEYSIANTADTVFRIGSTSKQFTAMAIALLSCITPSSNKPKNRIPPLKIWTVTSRIATNANNSAPAPDPRAPTEEFTNAD